MKTHVFFCFLLFLAASVFAQNWFFGGSVDVYTLSSEELHLNGLNRYSDDMRLEISPIIGYKINKFDFGINPLFQYRVSDIKNEHTPSWDVKASRFGIGAGLFSRYTILSFKNISILGHLGAEYLYFTLDTITPVSTTEEITHQVSLNLGPVFEYKIIDRLSVYTDFGIGRISCSFSNMSVSDTAENSSSTRNENVFGFSLPSSFNLNITSFAIGLYINL